MSSSRSILTSALLGLALLAVPADAQHTRPEQAKPQARPHQQTRPHQQARPRQQARPHQAEPQRSRSRTAPEKQHKRATPYRGVHQERQVKSEKQGQRTAGERPGRAAGQKAQPGAPAVHEPVGARSELTSYPSRVQAGATQSTEQEAPGSRWKRVDPTEAKSIEQARQAEHAKETLGGADPGRTPAPPELDAAARKRAAMVPDSPATGRPRAEDPALVEARRRGSSAVRGAERQARANGGANYDAKTRSELSRHTQRMNQLNYSREIALQFGSTQKTSRIDGLLAQESARHQQALASLAEKRNAEHIKRIADNPDPALNRLDTRNRTNEQQALDGERKATVDQQQRGQVQQAKQPEPAKPAEPPARPKSTEP